jgi:hypothetical protein
MGKFLKFKIANGETVASGSGAKEVLIPVDQIASIVDGANAASVVIKLENAATYTFTLGTTVVSAPITGASNLPAIVPPTAPTVASNMPSQAINRALTANPGGVTSMAQLGFDGGGDSVADDRMYFVQVAIA